MRVQMGYRYSMYPHHVATEEFVGGALYIPFLLSPADVESTPDLSAPMRMERSLTIRNGR